MPSSPDQPKPALEQQIEIDATPEQVWSIVADPAAMVRHSPMVIASFVRRRPVRLGTRALNVNRQGFIVWPMRTKVVEYDEPHRYAFVAKDNRSVWSFELQPTETGTLLIQRRETPRGLSPVSVKFGRLFPGGHDNLDPTLLRGMRRTLESIKGEAEGRTAA